MLETAFKSASQESINILAGRVSSIKTKIEMAKQGKKDSSMTSYEPHELKSMADKCQVTNAEYLGAIKRKLNTNNPDEIENYISDLKSTGKGIVISYQDLFGKDWEGE